MQNVALASPAPGLSADVPVLGDGTVMLYSDARASEQAARLSASLGMPVAATSLLAKLAYLDDHRVPRRRLQLSLGAADALVFDLCACLVTDPTNASTTGLTSPPHRAYDAGLLSRAGLDGWTPALPPISSGIPRVCAHVSAAAAGGFGLPQLAGVPVVHAGGDAASATLGAGCASPEDGRYLYVGSSGWVGRTVAGDGLASEQAARSKNGVLYLAHPHSPAHSLEVGSMSDAGSCLTWAARTLLGDMSVARLVHLAGQAPVGSNGVTFSPWLTGRRCPSPCTAATASLQGVTSGTQSADIARAVLEGVAFGLRGCLDATRDGRGAPRDLSLAFVGGGAQSAVMSRILAGVLGCELRVRARRSVGVVGAATVGLRAIGRDCHVGRVDGDGGRAATVTASELEREAYDALWNAGLGAA
jgi:xylulokinase